MKTLLFTLTLLVVLSGTPTAASEAYDVDALLAAKEAPAGVVFEVVSGDGDVLGELMPVLKTDIQRLRARYPDLPVAVVSHGAEQFALTRDNKKNASRVHAITEELVTGENVDVHVCGTHASWYDVLPEDFPDYVDVSATGPAQIKDYRELGYVLIVLP